MAKKFYSNIQCWYSSLDPLAITVSTFPLLCDGVIAGNQDNPFTSLSFVAGQTGYERTCQASSGNFPCTTRVGISIYGGTYLNTELLVLTDESNYTNLNKWVDRNNSGGGYTVTEVETTTIAGRYRFNDTLTSLTFPMFLRSGCEFTDCYIGIPIKFILNDTINYGLRWTVNRTSSTTSGVNNITSNAISVISLNGVESVSLRNQVIDFGTSPQDIPAPIANWIYNNSSPVYSNTYTVKSFTGEETLGEIIESPPMREVTLGSLGNEKTLTMVGVNGREYTITWRSETPVGKKFLGLSNFANSNRPSVPADTTVGVTWDGNITLYECYGTYRPPVTTFDINLYKNSAEVNRVDKETFLESVGTLSGALRDECSLITPSIVYQSTDVPTFNYVYIPIFNRYYYVTSLSSVGKNVWRMELNCDVLMSYKDSIYTLQGVIGRQENDYNPLLVDTEIPTQNNPIVEVIDIPSDAFNTQTSDNGHNFLITVIGA